MRRLEVLKNIIKNICWVCNGVKCKVCHNKGYWEESIYYHIVTDEKGNKYCFSGDSLK